MTQHKFDAEDVQNEYDRWVSLIGPADPYVGHKTIGIHEVLHAHFLLVDFFFKSRLGIGGTGPKDINLLHSALGRQFVCFGGKEKWTDPVDICATLMYGLIKNHPFFDANKRTAFLVSLLHLQKVGRTPTAQDKEYEDFTVAIAKDALCEYRWYDEFDLLSPDREIATISRFLKKNSRKIDLRSKTITYHDLNTLLNGRGLRLQNPKHNRIDLVRYVDADGETPLAAPTRIARVGFHGWTKQVSIKDIGIVRNASKLDAKHGYDTQSFFHGLDDPLSLIKKYREPLRRLAFR